jgi:tRNA(Ile)-lysidine synthase
MLLSVEDLAQRSLVLQRRALRQAVRQVKGDLENVAFKHIEQIVDALRQQPHKGRWTLPDEVDVALEGRTLSIRKRKDREDVPPDPSQRWTLNVPGAVDIPELGMRLEAAVVEGVPPVEHHPQKAFVDADKLEKALTVRLPQVGERFRPLGMNGTKKVMELLGDVKVPRQQRMRTPMVLSDDAIVWVVGYRIDDRFKVTSSTRRTVILKRFNVQTFKRSNVLQ